MEQPGKYYDQLAPIYDKATGDGEHWSPPRFIGETLRGLRVPCARILDYGVGTGQSVRHFVERADAERILGVDASQEMVRICREKFPQIEVRHGEIEALRDEDVGAFTLILSSGVLEFVEPLDAYLSRFRQLLDASGVLAFTYEPIIHFHPAQAEAVTTHQGKAMGDTKGRKLTTFRRHPQWVASRLEALGFRTEFDQEFVSYKRAEVDVVYHLVVARVPGE